MGPNTGPKNGVNTGLQDYTYIYILLGEVNFGLNASA